MGSTEQRTKPQALYIWRLKHSRLRAEFHDRVAGSISKRFRTGWLVDVGCGPGLLARRLISLTPELRIVGVDIDIMMLKEARISGCPYLIRASADSLPFRSNAIGIVVSTTSLKDWKNQAEGLAEIGRVVRPGGTGLVYDFITVGPGSNPPDFVRRFGIVSELLRRATGLVQPFSLQDVRKLAGTIGTRETQVAVNLESDLAIVRILISKISDEGAAAVKGSSIPPSYRGNHVIA
jgi:ubiquinone/menaquinone biosynthesis C-methylase UbiE